ncbi:hypothetical protein M501DRAFT_1003620 [Patellaria atrata CBS 101060]|uniref:Secreted protein n=1 Tax=Patellaria atrata CBS 101060 TaxID=1346257 RepID=A0A9P4VPR2_9PEZI|nr:hypothetical protein M501DRAFT_1003620 [Patellaria atrata CBS 101060]
MLMWWAMLLSHCAVKAVPRGTARDTVHWGTLSKSHMNARILFSPPLAAEFQSIFTFATEHDCCRCCQAFTS